MTQLPLLTPRTPPPAVGFWPDLGRWMVGEGPEPVELAAVLVGLRHRRRQRGER